MSKIEIWKPVLGAEGHYEVSNFGNVKSLKGRSPRLMRLGSAGTGHKGIQLGSPRRGRFTVHRLVLEAFVGPCPTGMEAAHLNGKPADNRAENLIWCTRKENHSHKKLHGTYQGGQNNEMAKLKNSDIPIIRQRIKNGDNNTVIARDYGVHHSTISEIKRGKRWTHVT